MRALFRSAKKRFVPCLGIIPDENYEDFLNLVKAPAQVIQDFIADYSIPFYVDFLKFIMCHIIKIWKLDYDHAMSNINQQHTVKAYDPERVVDKLVAIFKQLIFRYGKCLRAAHRSSSSLV